MSTEACNVFGGTWCQNPVDCTVLQDCIQEYIDLASEDQVAFKEYLESAPAISDPTDSIDCGMAREYFGYEDSYTNDADICENIEEFQYTDDFTILDNLFGGSNTKTFEDPGDDLEEPEVGKENGNLLNSLVHSLSLYPFL